MCRVLIPGAANFQWRTGRAWRRVRLWMSDPTLVVLSATFAAAILVFLAGASRRRDRGGNVPPAGPEEIPVPLESSGPEHPYRPPGTVAVSPPPLPGGGIPLWPYRSFDLLGIGFVAGIFALLVLAAAAASSSADLKLNAPALLVNIGFQIVMAGLVVGAMAWRIRPVDWLGLRWRQWPWVLLIAPASVVTMWVVFGGLQASGYVEWMESLGSETVQETVKLLRESSDPLVLGLMAVAAVIVAPVCEEIVFRGYVYPVAKRYAGAWPAALCSALVFSAAHGNLTALLPLFLFGLLLVLLYEKTRSIWAPVAVHFCFNGATVAVQLSARYFDIPLETMK